MQRSGHTQAAECSLRRSDPNAWASSNNYMRRSCLLLYPILLTTIHRARHVAISHPPVKVASTSQARTHQSRSHPLVKVASTSQARTHQSGSHPLVRVASTSQGLIHQSRSRPPVKVTPTGQGRTHQARPHPPAQVAPTSQGHTSLSMSIRKVACTVAVRKQVSLPCRAQNKEELAICSGG